MNIKALRAFHVTFTKGTLAAAAKELHLSQSAVSRLISGLEHELKLTLFDRTTRSLKPTESGLEFYREAGKILDYLEEIPRIASEIRQGKRKRIRIIAMPRIAQTVAVPALADFMRDFPDVACMLREILNKHNHLLINLINHQAIEKREVLRQCHQSAHSHWQRLGLCVKSLC